MPAGPLVKHPIESRAYGFDFGTEPANTLGQRGVVWDTPALASGEGFSAALTLPLLMGSMVPASAAPVVTALRVDGGTPNVTIGTPQAAGNRVTFQVSGGTVDQGNLGGGNVGDTDNVLYLFQCVVSTNLANVLVGQGYLKVQNLLP